MADRRKEEKGKEKLKPISASKQAKKRVEHIPCLFVPHEKESTSNKLCLFFHGNAEDIGLAFDLVYFVG